MLLSIEIDTERRASWSDLVVAGSAHVVLVSPGDGIALYARLRTRREVAVGVAWLLGMAVVITAVGFAVAVNLDAGDTGTALLGAAFIGGLASAACRRVIQLLRPRVWLRVPASVAPHLGLCERGGGA